MLLWMVSKEGAREIGNEICFDWLGNGRSTAIRCPGAAVCLSSMSGSLHAYEVGRGDLIEHLAQLPAFAGCTRGGRSSGSCGFCADKWCSVRADFLPSWPALEKVQSKTLGPPGQIFEANTGL